DGKVTITSLYGYICKNLPPNQTPMMFGLHAGSIELMCSVTRKAPGPADDVPPRSAMAPRSPISLSVKKRFPFYYRGQVLPGGHTDMVSSVAMTASGDGAISGSADQQIRYWDLNNKPPISRKIGEHGYIVRSVALAPTASRAVASSDDIGLA